MTPGGHQQLHSMNMFPVSMYRGPEEVSPEYAGYTESLNHPHQDIRMSKRIDTYPIIPQLQSTSSLPPQQQHQQSQPQGGRKRPQPKSNNNMQQPNIQSNMQPLVQDNQGQMTGEPLQPPAKKSRTNTPWTAAEEQRLRVMRDAGNSWADIAKTFPSRTEGSVKKHWYKDMHYADFAEDESVALLNAIKEYETNKWKVIGAKVGKPAKACEQYAKENFGNKV